MKIEVGGRLLVQKGARACFDAAPDDITKVTVMTGRDHEWPTVLSFLPKQRLRLQRIALSSGDQSVTLTSYDAGFGAVVPWLASHGWKVEGAIARSLETPYVREPVQRQ